jgi:hypothetical protein
LLVAKLAEHGINQTKPFTLSEMSMDTPRAVVLLDGDY